MGCTRTNRVAVLMYHDVSGGDAAAGYTVSRRRLEEGLGAVLAPGGVVECRVTFDDGRAGTFVHGLPVLDASGVRATLFATVGWLGRPGFMDARMVRAWHRAGHRVGSHAMTHRPLDALPEHEARTELADSKARLEDLVGAPVDELAFPGGNENARLRAWALEAGYARLYTSEPAFAPGDASVVPRFAVRAGTPVEALRALRAGRVARGFLMDRLRWRVKRAVGGPTYVAMRGRLRRAAPPERGSP